VIWAEFRNLSLATRPRVFPARTLSVLLGLTCLGCFQSSAPAPAAGRGGGGGGGGGGAGLTAPSGPTGPTGPSGRLIGAAIDGVYVLGLEGLSTTQLAPFLANPDVDGFSLRAPWSTIEPTEGTFDWSTFDAIIPNAAQSGKKIMLRVLPGTNTPDWVYQAGAARFSYVDDNPQHTTFGQNVSMPVPWDAVWLAKWMRLTTTFATKYANNPAVQIIAVSGPADGGEMHLGDASNATGWQSVGYSTTALINAWTQTIDAFTAAFPVQHLSVAIANPVSFDDPATVVQGVIAHCQQVGVGIQGNWLSAKTTSDDPLYQDVVAFSTHGIVGFQMLSPSSSPRFGGDLMTAVQLAINAHAIFLEIYKPDVTQDATTINFAHQQLLALGS
jgi:hypothetical protein